MKLTYIIPCFNGMPYVLDAVASCLDQKSEARIEVVLVDDGSNDGSADSVYDRFGHAENLKIVRQANTGESGAINAGLKHASGDYICILSADDLVSANHASLSLGLAEDSGAGVIYPDWNRINEDGKTIARVSTENFRQNRLWNDFVCIPGPGAIIARGIIGESLRPGLFRYIDDYAQWLVLSGKSQFKRLAVPLASWRHHAGQATQNSNGLIAIEQWRLIEMISKGFPPFDKNQKLAQQMAASLWVLQTTSNVRIETWPSDLPSVGKRFAAILRFSIRHPLHATAFLMNLALKPKRKLRVGK